MNLLRKLVLVILPFILVGQAGTSPIQQSSNEAKAQAPDGVTAPQGLSKTELPATAGAMKLGVLVTNKTGNIVTGLDKSQFRVIDDGVPQRVDSVELTPAPITIVLVAEYSAHSYGYFAGRASDWASRFLNYVEPTDWTSLVTFDMRSTVQVDFTHRIFDVREALRSLGSPQFSEADLFDALIDTLDKLAPVKGRKSILLLATGVNTFSAANLDDVLNRLKRSNTVLFAVGLAEAESMRYGMGISYQMSKNWLDSFAHQTGGLAFFPRFDGEIPEISQSIVGYLRNEYTVVYTPTDQRKDGRYHRLKVAVVGNDGKALKVSDDHGKLQDVEVYARDGYVPGEDDRR